ncbi:hypothetical protein L208DRAFT_531623 [Tricholoma matsutake]|nr:hypothetical protein L208DRAFT_531623 [Tricholoma matsutake 945]
MEDDDLRIHRAASSHDHHSHLALKQAGRKSTSLISRDRSIDSSVTSPHTTAARKVTPISQSHGSQSALPSKRIRPHVSSAQNTSMGPPIATTNNTRWTNELLPFSRRVSEELHSSQTSQNPGSQASSLILSEVPALR